MDCGGGGAEVPDRMSVAVRNHFVAWVFFFHFYVDFGDQTRFTSLAKQVPLPAGLSQMPASFYIRNLNDTVIKI